MHLTELYALVKSIVGTRGLLCVSVCGECVRAGLGDLLLEEGSLVVITGQQHQVVLGWRWRAEREENTFMTYSSTAFFSSVTDRWYHKQSWPHQ